MSGARGRELLSPPTADVLTSTDSRVGPSSVRKDFMHCAPSGIPLNSEATRSKRQQQIKSGQAAAPTRLRPSTLTFGRALSRMTCSTVPVCPLSLPAMIMTVSPRTTFHRPDSNIGLMYRPLPLWCLPACRAARIPLDMVLQPKPVTSCSGQGCDSYTQYAAQCSCPAPTPVVCPRNLGG